MAESPLLVIIEMINVLIENTLGTMLRMLGLSGDLANSLFSLSSGGGGLAVALAFLILGAVIFFIAKFFFGSLKTVVKLIVVGLVIVAVLIIGLGAL
jgi:hypothetical protein